MDENMRRLYSFNNRRDPVPDKAPEKPQESLPPKEGERALTVEQIDRIMEITTAWYMGPPVAPKTNEPYKKWTLRQLDDLRSSLIDKLGDGK